MLDEDLGDSIRYRASEKQTHWPPESVKINPFSKQDAI